MSNVLTEKFIRLKTAVGGNREVTAYEDTFGMTKEEQAHITRPNQWNTRILGELEFALNLREDGAFDKAIGRALDSVAQGHGRRRRIEQRRLPKGGGAA